MSLEQYGGLGNQNDLHGSGHAIHGQGERIKNFRTKVPAMMHAAT
jgi:hypothetical protein